MKNTFLLLVAVLLLVIFYVTGLSKYLGLAWYGKATFLGGAIGVVLAQAFGWVMSKNPVMAKWLPILIGFDFLMAVGVTYYFARIFIDSADFEPTAGYVWYIGYHISVALFIPVVAFALQKILKPSPATDV